MAGNGRARLTDSSEFERVYRRGVAYRGRLLSVHAFPNGLGSVRLGLSVSKKVGNAVVRNRVRRRIKELFRASIAEVSPGLDVVVSARPGAGEADSEDLRKDLQKALEEFSEKEKSKTS